MLLKGRWIKGAVVLLVAADAARVSAAPLDSLMTVDTPAHAGAGKLEAAYDAVNKTLDVFHIRASDPQYAGTNVGNYAGEHVLGEVGLSSRLALEGSFWRRQISYNADRESLHSWELALQYRLPIPEGYGRYALRVGTWGNYAGVLSKSTPTTIAGQQVSSISVSDPRDRQNQADLIGTWKPDGNWAYSAFLGGGDSSVRVGALTAGAGACRYAITFTATSVDGTQIGSCGLLLTSSFSKPTSTDESAALSYDAGFAHAGGSMRWQHGQWRLRAGYLREQLYRQGVDDIVERQGGKAYRHNNVFDGEIAWVFSHDAELFVRGEAMSNQFLGEIPFAYNAVTASKFNGKYGFASFGIRSVF